MQKKNTVVLCILDGWGIGDNTRFNAVSRANTANFDFLKNNFPTSKLRADGEYVGLLPGQMGNSEVGHITIGAGRAIPMSLPKLEMAIKRDTLKNDVVIRQFVKSLRISGGVAHLAGLFSSGGVHAHQDHTIYLANVIANEGIEVKLHLFLDGRDVPPRTAVKDVKRLKLILHENVKVATLVGRFYAMDRDNRWDRVEKAYHLMTSGIGEKFSSPEEVILSGYERGETDEFIKPAAVEGYGGFSKDLDGLLFTNFRSDRARELLSALCDPNFNKFERYKNFTLVSRVGLVEYSDEHNTFMESVLKPELIHNTIGECLSKKNKRQLRLAETEKYPHVTFFFNSGIESPAFLEKRCMVSSPKVTTYDEAPEMSANAITEKLLNVIKNNAFDFILVNYANPDMVGHTGNLDATIKACEVVDKCLGEVYHELKNLGGTLLLTSDHGNCEVMYDSFNQSPHTSHTLNPVPFIVVGVPGLSVVKDGSLSDIAPTILDILKIDVPMEMTGK